ncbi:redoxin domain-containing protein [Sphingobacterium sp. N143]|uniref:redoxin domain-containing protein n=1 Tax=Sphingobacterium sp. N143 TaxID=2746727 RepID=UPI0025783116|nr:redoxin domain-containing protein [Sphingobacterium sp. N143]MDM1292682.1 redoxin domain-containing protein [Sphingobacterium sp. N143]
MKKNLLSILFLAIAGQAVAQKTNTVVTGKLDNLSQEEWIYLSGFGNGQKDSVRQTEKGFRFDLDIPEGEGDFYILQVGKMSPSGEMNGDFIFLEKGKLHISGKSPQLREAKYSGGKLADYHNSFQQRQKVEGLEDLHQQFAAARKNKDQDQMATIRKAIDLKNAEQATLDKAFVLKHKKSPAIVYPLFFTLRNGNNLAELDSLLQQLAPQAKNNVPVKTIEYSIKTDKLTGVGRQALPFSQADTLGKTVSLADFQGKYVLIDFWASWCVPCRMENPNVVSAYQQYKNKNFTVLGISFDYPGQQQRWLDAIHSDNLSWTQLSDLKGWKNEVGVLYDIKSIPSNLLIDPKGVIIAKNLRGDALDNKLKELLGEPVMDKSTFVIKGEVENPDKAAWFHIRYTDAAGQNRIDSAQIFNGVFSYLGKVQSATQASAYFSDGKSGAPQSFERYLQFYVEPGVLQVKGSTGMPQDIQLSGTKTQNEYNSYRGLIKTELAAIRPLSKQYNNKNNEYIRLKKQGATEAELQAKLDELENLKEAMSPYQKIMREKQFAYIKQHPNSLVSASQVRFFVSSADLAELQGIYAQMDTEVQNSADGKELAAEIAKLKSGSAGATATDFSGMDIQGKPLKLSDYRGKYVLLDFWASWCVPCRKGNPHLLQLYGKYKKKGFEIIGVSDDDSNEKAWRKAVDQDKIGVWKHVLRGLKRTAQGDFDKSEDKSEAYGIHSLPTKILIDPQGIIVGRYGGGGGSDEDLDAKLKTIFKL